jgi:hypothetical protein
MLYLCGFQNQQWVRWSFTAVEFWILYSKFNPNIISKSMKAAADLGPERPEGQVMTFPTAGEYHVPGSTLFRFTLPTQISMRI